ncbi:MAG: T9SS C-terminal target domain-containing protein [Sphingobacteriia bacterium]|nr:T9SS C-terminal target domain-containing protein [Sphingobacteriia bacterium]
MCDGGSATVTASGATTYTWNGVPMGGNNVYVASPAQTATYVLLANTNSITTNCPSTHTVQVVVNTNPTVTVIPTRSVICKGQTNTLTATGAASVVWQGTLGITNAVVIKPSITTVYTLTGTSAEGCTTTAQVSAVVSACNGIAEFSNTRQIRVYPNPNNGQFSISSESASIVYLSNAIGQVIQKLELNSDNNFRADLSGLAKGVYFLSAGENQSAKKLIVD